MNTTHLTKIATFTISLLLLGVGIAPNISADNSSLGRTIYVDDDNTEGPWDGTKEHPYQFIHEGIKAANDGDMVYVFNGTYREAFTIDKSIEVVGENKESTIILGWWSFVVRISENNVTFQGFTIQKDEESPHQLSNGIKVLADYTTIRDNILSNTTKGVFLYSDDNIITNNSFIHDGIYVYLDANDNIIKDNTVNGKTLVYLEGETNRRINADAGQVILVDCENITIEKQTLRDSSVGVQLIRTNNSWIKNNCIGGNYNSGIMCEDSNRIRILNNVISSSASNGGITLSRYSTNNSIANNTISNSLYGVELYRSYHNIIIDNIIMNNNYGIKLFSGSSDNMISKNCISNNKHGIHLSRQTDRNNISFNVFSNNTLAGITIDYYTSNGLFFSDNIISDNSFYNNGLYLRTTRVTTVSNNMVNGKPLIYLDGVSHKTIDNAGQVILIDCEDITIRNQELTNATLGIQLLQTSHCQISKNNISSNSLYGIWIWKSDDNTITNNIITNNHYNGIILEYSDRNTITSNEIRNNEYGICFYDYIEWGWEFPETSKSNRITRNNIYHNTQQEAFFHNSFFNQWNSNYWGVRRLFYPVKGEIYLERGWHWGSPPPIDLSIFRLDWHPAKEPYDI